MHRFLIGLGLSGIAALALAAAPALPTHEAPADAKV